MGFRFQRRLNLGSGVGLNLSKTGASASSRTFLGSIGTRASGFKTGIRGLSYRKLWGRGGIGLVFGSLMIATITIANFFVFFLLAFVILLSALFHLMWVAAVLLFELVSWCILTVYDLVKYMAKKHNWSGKVG
jgi:hypothetical protein